MKTVELDDTGISLQNFHLVTFGCSAPLCATDVARVEGEGVAATCGLPAESIFGKPAFAMFSRQVQVDVVEAFTRGALVTRRSGGTTESQSGELRWIDENAEENNLHSCHIVALN